MKCSPQYFLHHKGAKKDFSFVCFVSIVVKFFTKVIFIRWPIIFRPHKPPVAYKFKE